MIEELQEDYATLSRILEQRRAVTTVTMSVGMQLLWKMYLTILEDAAKTINALIQYLAQQNNVIERRDTWDSTTNSGAN